MLDLNDRARAVVANPAAPTTITLAGFASAIATVVIPALSRLPEALSLIIVEAEDREAMRDLSLGHVEVVLTQEYGATPPKGDPRLVYTPVARDELKIVLGADRSPQTTLQDLTQDTWLLNGEATRCTAATERILAAAGIRPAISANVSDNETLLALVAAGHGVSIMPQLAIAQSAAAVGVANQNLGETRHHVCRPPGCSVERCRTGRSGARRGLDLRSISRAQRNQSRTRRDDWWPFQRRCHSMPAA